MNSVEELIGASSRADPRARAVDSHEVRERHFHWPETERTRAAWVDWEWRAWGVAHRARAAARRAWQSLTTRDHAHDLAGHGDGAATRRHPPPATEGNVDAASDMSFPASDPPAWMGSMACVAAGSGEHHPEMPGPREPPNASGAAPAS